MPVGHAVLRVDVLPQRRAQIRRLQIVRRQRVACQQRVHISVFDQRRKRPPRIAVKGERRPQHPDDLAVVAVVAQHVVKLVVVPAERRLAAAPLAEREDVAVSLLLFKPVRPDEDALAAVLRAAGKHPLALLQPPRLTHVHAPAVRQHRHAVHARFRRQHPFSAHPEVFRKDAHRMVVLRRDPVQRRLRRARVRRALQPQRRKVRRSVFFQLKGHVSSPFTAAFGFHCFPRQRVVFSAF